MARAISKHTVSTSLRQQFNAIVAGIERQAIAAAHELGFEGATKKQVLAAIHAELTWWEREYNYSMPLNWASAPNGWNRAVCLDLITILLEEIHQYLVKVIFSTRSMNSTSCCRSFTGGCLRRISKFPLPRVNPA